MTIRQVKLTGGVCDGAFTLASHDTAWHQGELYVWNGEDDRKTFIHCKTALRAIPERDIEMVRVQTWIERKGEAVRLANGQVEYIPAPMSELIGIPPWRINAWIQYLRTK